MGRAINGLVILGIIVTFLGIAGLAIPVVTTQQTTDVAKVGGLQIQAKEDTPHVIPPLLSGGAILLGLVFIGAGLYQRK